MIKLFITDLDGCVTDPFITPDWKAFSKIRQLNLNSHYDPNIPPLTICTGRPMPYAEAMAQILGIRIPFLFESGGGMYDVAKNELTWTPELNDERKREVKEIKKWAVEKFINSYEATIPEFAKFTDVGIINQNSEIIYEIRDASKEFISNNYPHFEVHHTEVSVNIILKKANKGEGIKMICKHFGYSLDEVAYIGDSSGDIPGLNIVKLPFAPVNAAEPVKQVADVMRGKSTDGVLEAYHKIIEYNINY
ncbi:MAG: HAD-IIB family hydrolase [bacterium]|nr:HAD-IIB family hydrolase [bacterium]